ncbi:MAG: aspartyl protease family protein [Bacteroidota bacterium]
MRCLLIFLLHTFFVASTSPLSAQNISTSTSGTRWSTDNLPSNTRKQTSIYENTWKSTEIPFQFINGLIIVEVTLDHQFPLKFLFDTGAEHTILTERTFADALGKNYVREFSLYGADMTTPLQAYLVREVHLSLGQLSIPQQSLLVLQEDYFNFGAITGIPLHGILGASLFQQFMVQIDYARKKIRLHRPRKLKLGKKWQRIPMQVFKGKPFVEAELDVIGKKARQFKFLLDTGAALPLLLYTDTTSELTIPPKALGGIVGRGLGGNLMGFKGRVQMLKIGDAVSQQVIAHFQQLDSLYLYHDQLLNGRHGIIGNGIISRFDIILDYWKEQLYLRPNRKFGKHFRFDRSGLIIVASGKNLHTYYVQYIHPHSPADAAGIRAGDQILSINSIPTSWMNLETLLGLFQKKVGKCMRITLLRDGQRIKTSFQLRELL